MYKSLEDDIGRIESKSGGQAEGDHQALYERDALGVGIEDTRSHIIGRLLEDY